jgi:uncharacterized protein YciI
MLHYQDIVPVFLLAIASMHSVHAQDANRDYFVFLTTGKSTEGISPEVIQQKQAAHLENFGRLAKLDSLTVAGPCADPKKKTRGIVVVHADSIADAGSKFAPDPYVSEGFMKLELHQFKTIVGKLRLITENFTLEENVIAIASRGPKWTDKEQDAKIASAFARFAKEQFEGGKLGFAAEFSCKSNNESGRAAAMIFRGKELASVTDALQASDLVRDGLIIVEAFPQYMAKGAME